MKHTPLMTFAAVVPLLAVAGGGGDLQSKVDVQKLQEDIQVSQVIGAEVQQQGAQGGERNAEVEDVLIASDGRIEAVLIDGLNPQDGGDDQSGAQPDDQRVSATQDDSGGQTGASVGTTTDEGLTKVQWEQVSYDPAAETVSLTSGGSSGMQSASMPGDASGMQSGSTQGATTGSADTSATGMQASSTSTGGQSGSGGESFEASELIGMEVHLSDAKSFGEVGDVLINEQEGKASALVVNAWEGFDRQTYALPVELEGVDREDNAIDYAYTESDVIALQEFEQDR